MNTTFGMRPNRILVTSVLGVSLTAALSLGVGTAAHADGAEQVLLNGSTTASYFWDDASGRAGDTGMPASGKPMQKGLAASPSWPLGTEGYVTYKGKKAKFFVGDRGPGNPSNQGIMLDLDAKTFAALTGGRFNPSSLMVTGNGGKGHIDIKYTITKWGPGLGKKNYPVAFSTGAWGRKDHNPAKPPKVQTIPVDEKTPGTPAKRRSADVIEVAALAGAGVAGAGLYLGRDRIRQFLSH
jgi:hypothetical protein